MRTNSSSRPHLCLLPEAVHLHSPKLVWCFGCLPWCLWLTCCTLILGRRGKPSFFHALHMHTSFPFLPKGLFLLDHHSVLKGYAHVNAACCWASTMLRFFSYCTFCIFYVFYVVSTHPKTPSIRLCKCPCTKFRHIAIQVYLLEQSLNSFSASLSLDLVRCRSASPAVLGVPHNCFLEFPSASLPCWVRYFYTPCHPLSWFALTW